MLKADRVAAEGADGCGKGMYDVARWDDNYDHGEKFRPKARKSNYTIQDATAFWKDRSWHRMEIVLSAMNGEVNPWQSLDTQNFPVASKHKKNDRLSPLDILVVFRVLRYCTRRRITYDDCVGRLLNMASPTQTQYIKDLFTICFHWVAIRTPLRKAKFEEQLHAAGIKNVVVLTRNDASKAFERFRSCQLVDSELFKFSDDDVPGGFADVSRKRKRKTSFGPVGPHGEK